MDQHCRAKRDDRLYFFQQLCDNIHDFKESGKEISHLQQAYAEKKLQDPEFGKQVKAACIKSTNSSKQIFEAVQEHLTVAAWNDLKNFSWSNLFH